MKYLMKTLLTLLLILPIVANAGYDANRYDANRILLSPSAARTMKFNTDNRVMERSMQYRINSLPQKRIYLTVKLK